MPNRLTPEAEAKLRDLVNELQTQDNAITADPLFVVQQVHRIYGMDPIYADEFTWFDPDDVEIDWDEDDLIAEIRANHQLEPGAKIDPADHGYRKVYHVDRWEFVCAHLTRRAAEAYIRANLHNLKGLPRVYVTSQRRCHEFNETVAALPAVLWEIDALRLAASTD